MEFSFQNRGKGTRNKIARCAGVVKVFVVLISGAARRGYETP